MNLARLIRNLPQILHSNAVLHWIRQYNSQTISVSNQSAIIISPHQDDETLGCGGLIALKRQQGNQVAIVFLTDGGASRIFDPSNLDLISLRRQEAIAALNTLGVPTSDIHFLNYPDGELQELSEAQQHSLATQLSALVEQYQAQEIYVPHAKDGHRDHEAAFQITQTAIATLSRSIELFQYPIWLFWKRPIFLKLHEHDLTNAYRVDISLVQARKHKAIQAYQSQLPFLPVGFIHPYLDSTELFFRTAISLG